MTWFIVGLVTGLIVSALLLAVLWFTIRPRRHLARDLKGYRKVMVATIDQPFYAESLTLASRITANKGILETIYLMEIPLNRPLEGEAGDEVDVGMKALEEAAGVASEEGVLPLPRLERTRMASKTMVELQGQEGFDAIVLDIRPGKRTGRVGRRIAEYVQEHATCPVVVVSESEEADDIRGEKR